MDERLGKAARDWPLLIPPAALTVVLAFFPSQSSEPSYAAIASVTFVKAALTAAAQACFAVLAARDRTARTFWSALLCFGLLDGLVAALGLFIGAGLGRRLELRDVEGARAWLRASAVLSPLTMLAEVACAAAAVRASLRGRGARAVALAGCAYVVSILSAQARAAVPVRTIRLAAGALFACLHWALTIAAPVRWEPEA